MRNNDNIIFIDGKGASHNMRVQSFREDRDAKNELIHHEPLVTGNYGAPPTGEPKTLIDVPHISHPTRQENNPDLPSYPLHAWKYEHEDHLELPADHPVHDHFNEQPQRDEQGKIVPKRRPLHEAHIAAHRAQQGPSDPAASNEALRGGQPNAADLDAVAKEEAARRDTAGKQSGHHPGNPETVHFDFKCQSCDKDVKRLASHHGGTQFEADAINGQWVKHECSAEDVQAFRERLAEAKKPKAIEVPLTPSERLAAGEQIAKVPEPANETFYDKIEEVVEKAESAIEKEILGEPDVIAELEKAPPAPIETETKPPTDAA